jgi:hypothetical protein
MPGTASSPLNSRVSAKARPSAATRAANLIANTPVLFRLPAIQNLPNPTPSVPVAAIAANEDGDIGAAHVDAISQLQDAKPQGQTPDLLLKASPSATSNEAAPISQPSPRSWWEHWSSGIVLIVLIIALATAGILAFRSGKSNDAKIIADVDSTQSVTQHALSTLSVIEVPGIPQPANTPSVEATESLVVNSPAPTELRQTSGLTTTAPPSSQSLSQNAETLILNEKLVLNSTTSSSPTTSIKTFLGADISQYTNATPTAASTPTTALTLSEKPDNSSTTPHATASLYAPVGVQPPRLFEEPAMPSQYTNVQATPTSSTSTVPTPGASPSLYDNSSTMAANPTTSELGANANSTLIPTTNPIPAFPVSTGLAQNYSAGSLLNSPVTEQTQVSAQPSTQTTAPKTGETVIRSTNTPEFDLQLLKAYQEFTRTPVPNRYQAPSSGLPTSDTAATTTTVQTNTPNLPTQLINNSPPLPYSNQQPNGYTTTGMQPGTVPTQGYSQPTSNIGYPPSLY